MRRASLQRLRAPAGLVVLVAVAFRSGTGPFLDALHDVDLRLLGIATAIAVATTTCAAWRWCLVAKGLGVSVPLSSAIAACYRSQFLNAILPGGVLGDVHRGVRHGREVGDVGLGLRAVGWERSAGQVVQGGLTVAILVAVPSPSRPATWRVALSVIVVAGVVALLLVAARRGGPAPVRRLVRVAAADVQHGLLAPRAWPGVLLASVAVVAGHVGTFLMAARATGSVVPPTQLLPLALLVLVASGVPANIAGWGPREGAAAWAFAAAGFGASAGISAAVAYGVMAFVASLPGAGVLAWHALRGRVGEPVVRVPSAPQLPALEACARG